LSRINVCRVALILVNDNRIPAGFLVLQPLAHTVAVGLPCGVGDVVDKVPWSLAERKHAQAFALACPVHVAT